MRVVFAGTPPFAAAALEALAAAGHDIPLVLTQPDRPAGRGLRLMPSAVADAARRLGFALEKPPTLKSPEAQRLLEDAAPDVLVVAAYGLLLPAVILAIPARGCLNIHASLLPRWRGAAPIHRAIMAGDRQTGITIMQMDAGLDTGPMLLSRPMDIAPRDTTGSLTSRLAELGASCIVEALATLDSLRATPQDGSGATYAAKISKEEARIDWRESAAAIDRKVRALDPAPGAEARLDGEALKIWSALPAEGSGRPGEVLEATALGLLVACGQGALRITQLQRPGGKRLEAPEFMRGKPVPTGAVLV